ncbi:acid protease [Aureobasidium sp. EXF-10728]|nr:acid protease [Aureobasidium sp. EXF-10728]
MHLFQILASTTAIYSLCHAQPLTAADVKGKAVFTLEQILNNNSTTKPPAQKLLYAYAKYAKAGASAPSAVRKAAASATIATVASTPEPGDVEYLCPVTVGGKTLNLNFDTGSADLWVYSNLQPSAQRSGHAYYNSNNANLMSGYTWDIEYGDGSGASGKVFADKVVVGSATATSQAVEAATSVSSGMISDLDSDGILGLAFSTVNTVQPYQQNNFFDTIKSQLGKPVFTADLKKGAPGSYDFGYIDTAKYTGSITYVNTDANSGFWQFSAGGYVIGSGAKVSKTYSCVADTGTSLLLLPSDVVSAYYKQVKGAMYSDYQGGWVFACNAKLPTWSAIIGGKPFTVPGSYMNYAALGNNLCFGGMQPDTGIGFSILGDVFLKSQFVVFSQMAARPQLGFAAKKL